jgi:signal transduction histidine kinase
MTLAERLLPASMAGQMIGVLALSFVALLTTLTAIEQSDQGSIERSAQSEFTAARLRNLMPHLRYVRRSELGAFISSVSKCHDGYAVTDRPYPGMHITNETRAVAAGVASELRMPLADVRAGRATLTRQDFGYSKCGADEMSFPFEGLVISLRQPGGAWVSAEVHPHERHLRQTFLSWLQRSGAVFLLTAAVAVFFMYRLGRPLRRLADAALNFGEGLKVEPLKESGPSDVRRTIGAFNAMQQRVTAEIARRTNTLAALSHDLRTPLTGLRMKVELVEDAAVRANLIASIRKMEAMATAALEFLRSEALDEPLRLVDLTALVESECTEFEDRGEAVCFTEGPNVSCLCRPDALARAVRNLLDNARKYAGSAEVRITPGRGGWVEIIIADQGPGIPRDRVHEVTQPFVRLSSARESEIGGFGLGLAVVKAVVDGHGGELSFAQNEPSGLIVTLSIPDHADAHGVSSQ